jgi:S1-C subfamily serine protease
MGRVRRVQAVGQSRDASAHETCVYVWKSASVNWVDVVILAFVVAAIGHGVATGAITQALSLGGFALGVVLGADLAPKLTGLATAPTIKAETALFCVFGLAALLAAVGHVVGSSGARHLRATPGRSVDASLGVVIAVVVTLAIAWLVGSMLADNPVRSVAVQVQRSAILRFLDRVLPPAPPVIARIQRLLDAGGLPEVFARLEPYAAPPLALPRSAVVQAAFAHSAASTIKIEGAACNGIQEGSGFVVAPGVVVTNAHVIAGVRHPFIVDNDTPTAATPVLFDPNLDIAVLRDPSVNGPSLPLAATNVPRGTPAAVVGYPGGGPIDAQPAVVLTELDAVGRNIYGTATTRRDVYEIEGIVRPGNSGGPLIEADGTVVGVVFARSTLNGDIGYALTSAAVRAATLRGETLDVPTPTGPCTAG